MIRIRKSNERGRTRIGWLDSYHTFSFGDYDDPANTSFRALRVMNEDRVAPGQGFGMHGHRDMEIVTYVLSGALQHKDSLGNGEALRPGELQRMTAGSGIRHSEFNPSASAPVHLYQIWLLPDRTGLEPTYEQKAFAESERRGRLRLVVSRDGREGSLSIHQDAELYLATLADGQTVAHALRPGRHAWLQALRGAVEVNGQRLDTADGAAISDEAALAIRAIGESEILLFDLA